jgi:osmotically-inducible protein OsmY
MTGSPERDEYRLQHVRERLAQDPRLNTLDVHLDMQGQVVVLTGHAETEERRQTIGALVSELLPGVEVDNRTTVEAVPDPEEAEEMG